MLEGEKYNNQAHFIEREQENTQKEIAPKDTIKVGIHTVMLGGGNGDIAVGTKFVDALSSSVNASHFDIRVYTKDFCLPHLQLFSEQLHNAPVISYNRGTFDEQSFSWEHPPQVNDQALKIDEDAMIFVHSYANEELLGDDTVAIEVTEYSSGVRKSDLAKKKVVVSTGFNFDPRKEAIQAGLIYSRQFESLLERVKTEKDTMLQSCEKSLQEQTGVAVDLQSNPFGFYYVSSLAASYAYFDILREAAPHTAQPITIVAPVGGNYADNRDAVPFEEKVAELGFNYVADGKKVDRESNITVINPHRIPNEIFQQLTILAELPTVATGDQSLTEAVQKSSSDSPNPFFAYTLETKQVGFLDFMERIDPYAAKFLASYYTHELTKEKQNRIFTVDYLRKKLAPHITSPLSKAEVARLFYDPEIIARFNKAEAAIPRQMVKDRHGYVDNPENLCDATKTIEDILEAVRMNKLEMVKQFIPHDNGNFK